MNELVKQQFDTSSVQGVDRPVGVAQIDRPPENESVDISVTGDPPYRYPATRPNPDSRKIAYAAQVGADPLCQNLRKRC